MCICVHIYEELFSKSMISELGIGIATSNFGMALNAFWKRTHHLELVTLTRVTYTLTIRNIWWRLSFSERRHRKRLRAHDRSPEGQIACWEDTRCHPPPLHGPAWRTRVNIKTHVGSLDPHSLEPRRGVCSQRGIYIYVYICIYMHICKYICMHMSVHMCTCTYLWIYM